MSRCFHSQKSFTLIELLFVIIVVGTLAALVFPRMVGRSEQAKVEVCRAFIKVELATALRMYEMDRGKFPTTDQGLAALIEKPIKAINWKPYLKRKPVDPWGREFYYISPGEMMPRSYDLYSLGADGEESEDDIANWQE